MVNSFATYALMAKENVTVIDFRIAPHRVIARKNIVEVVLDGDVVATIAANGIDSIQIMSAH